MFLESLSNLTQRLIISAISTTIVLFAIAFSQVPFFRPIYTLIAAVIIGLALWEYYQIANVRGFNPLTKLGIGFSIAYTFSVFLHSQYPVAFILPIIILGLFVITAFTYYLFRGSDPFGNLSISFFGILYITIPLSCIISITYFFPPGASQDGRYWLLYLFLMTKLTDAGAYFVGRYFGKIKMVPYISPKKTWEGAIAGTLTALVSSVTFFIIVNVFFESAPIALTFWQSIWLGLSISILGQFGDLAESLLKRDAGVKDSNYLPGLGGILDVLDSLVFTCPLMYIFLYTIY
jgi:phosphatidate cytidylyltransferase